jgi:hypothetical protein
MGIRASRLMASMTCVVGGVMTVVGCTSSNGETAGSEVGPAGVDGGAAESGQPAGMQKCPYGMGDCNGDPGDGCETPIVFDADNCGRCGRHCDDGECRDRTCTGTKLVDERTAAPFLVGTDIVAAGGRIYFHGADALGAAKTGNIWSMAATGGDLKMETDVDVAGFNVLGDTLLASINVVDKTLGAFRYDLLIVDRKTGAKRTVVMDAEKNECLGTRFWRTADEVISWCVLPVRSFNGSQNTIVAVKADGTLRRLWRRGCASEKNSEFCWDGASYGPRQFGVSEGMIGWGVGIDEVWLLPARPDVNEESQPARTYYDVLLTSNPSDPNDVPPSIAIDAEHLVFSAQTVGRGGLEFLKATERASIRDVPTFDFAALERENAGLATVLASDALASYWSPCAPSMCKAGETRSIMIMPWRPLDPITSEARAKLDGTPYYATGAGLSPRSVAADDRSVYWVDEGGLWRTPR